MYTYRVCTDSDKRIPVDFIYLTTSSWSLVCVCVCVIVERKIYLTVFNLCWMYIVQTQIVNELNDKPENGIFFFLNRKRFVHSQKKEGGGGWIGVWLKRRSKRWANSMHFKIHLNEINIHWKL